MVDRVDPLKAFELHRPHPSLGFDVGRDDESLSLLDVVN
jgi:hypothetical protein